MLVYTFQHHLVQVSCNEVEQLKSSLRISEESRVLGHMQVGKHGSDRSLAIEAKGEPSHNAES